MDIKAEILDTTDIEKHLDGKSANKYIKITLLGQSFVYHQIRKMVGTLVNICQESLPDTFIDECYGPEKKGLWLAPSEGLLLDRLNFDGYNKKSDIPEIIELSEDQKKVQHDFKTRCIYPEVLNSQEKNDVFTQWVSRHRFYIDKDKKEAEAVQTEKPEEKIESVVETEKVEMTEE